MTNDRTTVRPVLVLFFALSTSAFVSGCGGGGGGGPGTPAPASTASDASGSDISVAVTAPSSASTIDTTDKKMALSGTASGDNSITGVSWKNDRGGQGVASGTNNWEVTRIKLEMGVNKITVTARDTAGDSSSRTVSINRESGKSSSTTLSWSAPSERTDGSPLTNLAGYKILYGRMSEIYDYVIDIDNPGILSYVVEDLTSGDWYFSLVAYDTEGVESNQSNEVLRPVS